MEKLKRTRTTLKQRITRICSFVDDFQPTGDKQEIVVRAEKLEDLFKEYENVQNSIEARDDSEEADREDVENKYFHTKAKMNSIIKSTPASTSVETTNNPPQRKVKLPEITLPSFSGSVQEWASFSDMFLALVHNDSSLTDIQKFHYLRTSLRSEAAYVIQNLELSADNYQTAWDLLKTRYENKKLLVHSYLKSLFDLSPLTSENHYQLRQFIDNINTHTRALQILHQAVSSWDIILIYLFTSKLNFTLRKEWEAKVAQKKAPEMPTLKEFVEFLNQKCQTLELTDKGKPKLDNIQKVTPPRRNDKPISLTSIVKRCLKCKKDHPIYKCEEFLKMSVQDRIQEVKRLQLCINCMRPGHFLKNCKASSCLKCQKQHNTLLHKEAETSEQSCKNSSTEEPSSPQQSSITTHCMQNQPSYILLATAEVYVLDKTGNKYNCRILLDQGSQTNFITEAFARKLRLPIKSRNIQVSSVNETVSSVSHEATIQLLAKHNDFKASLDCLVVSRIIKEKLPQIQINTEQMKLPNHVILADPKFYIPAEIDVLVGAELFFSLLYMEQIKLGKNLPILQNTVLGWIVSGRIAQGRRNTSISCFVQSTELQEQLENFWNIEELPVRRILSREEAQCEEHFVKTHSRASDGRFVVALPLKDDRTKLGESRTAALHRLHSVERKMAQNPIYRERYMKFMQEYQQLNHMTIVDNKFDKKLDNQVVHYLPHHGIEKETSSTTKLRAVFDASNKTSSGLSLNDIMMIGPTIQQPLLSILIRFRQHKFVITADIEKMYRQILVRPEDRNLERIVWRENPAEPIQEFVLNTVTYGTAAAPFIATRCLEELARSATSENERISSIIINDFYMDDLLTGGSTVEEIQAIKDDLSRIMKSGGFHLTKWRSNLDGWLASENENPTKQDETSKRLKIQDNTTKTLGSLWNSYHDVIHYSVSTDDKICTTKRDILSQIAKLFDPMGLLSPVTIKAKLLIQEMWQLKTDWDSTIPSHIQNKWNSFYAQLAALKKLSIPRYICVENATYYELHGFADASEQAYGAVIYIRTINNDKQWNINLLYAKSRVAPLKKQSVPRLELCGALLLAEMYDFIKKTLTIPIDNTFLWTDSTVTLCWIRTEPFKLKTFVANRIVKIQELTNKADWHHISTIDNPADLITRGLNPEHIESNSLWWAGPSCLRHGEKCDIPTQTSSAISPNELDLKPTLLTTIRKEPFPVLTKISSWNKLVRIIAYCRRFLNNFIVKRNPFCRGHLTVEELEESRLSILRIVQIEAFTQEMSDLKAGKQVSKNSPLLPLNVYLENELIRVGGRLRHAKIDNDQKHPIVLPRDHHITYLIIVAEHERLLHAGQETVLSSLRSRYWPLSARRLIRKVIRNCMNCFRVNPQPAQQIMGDFPEHRVNSPGRPFCHSGVDYAGPVTVREDRRRRGRIITLKAYIAIFVCLTTKAVHIELVTSLSTEAFLAAIRRFCSRRGICSHLYSDNGTIFVGADHQLKELYQFLTENAENLARPLAEQKIVWHFIPPRAPDFGGLWESMVKSTKKHIMKVTQNALLTYEEYYTLLTGIEACLNSRPITPLSANPNDLVALTPAHFLIGNTLLEPVEEDLTKVKLNTLTRWQYISNIRQHFWNRWYRDYLHCLQIRSKWKIRQGNVKVGDMVLLIEENLPPLRWIRGRISEVHPGEDSVVRVVTIRTAKGLFKRSIRKICVLPVNDFDK